MNDEFVVGQLTPRPAGQRLHYQEVHGPKDGRVERDDSADGPEDLVVEGGAASPPPRSMVLRPYAFAHINDRLYRPAIPPSCH